MQANSLANFGVVANHHVRGDKYPITNSCGWIDYRGRMNRRLERSCGMKENQRAGVGKIRIFRAQQGDVIAGDLDVFANINSRSARRLHSRCVAGVGQERDLSGLRLIEPRCTLDLDVASARATSRAGLRGEFGKFHGREFSAIFGKSDKVVFSLSLWERVGERVSARPR